MEDIIRACQRQIPAKLDERGRKAALVKSARWKAGKSPEYHAVGDGSPWALRPNWVAMDSPAKPGRETVLRGAVMKFRAKIAREGSTIEAWWIMKSLERVHEGRVLGTAVPLHPETGQPLVGLATKMWRKVLPEDLWAGGMAVVPVGLPSVKTGTFGESVGAPMDDRARDLYKKARG